MAKRKALIVVPTFAGVQPRPFRQFLQMMIVAGRTCPEWSFAVLTPERQSLPMAMNHAAQIVLEQAFDALIACDDDCFPPYDAIPRLIVHHEAGRAFVAGVGVMKSYPHTTTVAKLFPEGPTLTIGPHRQAKLTGHQWLDDVSTLPDLADVDFCGVPVAIISRQALETIPPPWFGLNSDDGGMVTHDIFFCRKLQAAGLSVLVDTTLKCGHLAEAPIVTFENRGTARELVDGPC